ncbi:MAG: hypothetical protein HYV27_12475 [Candidatus Hydrogenedentes bacterium]|nr:hypothetical protein [Candidatus Hydrogenedentota bacterium]
MNTGRAREYMAAAFALILVLIMLGVASQVFGWNIPLLTPFIDSLTG